jgi:hypothetical protein
MRIILSLKPMEGIRENSPKLADEKSGKNTLRITKKKNVPYNLETRFTQKDQLYWENQMSTRCRNHYNILPLFKDWRDLSLFLLFSITLWSTPTPFKKQLCPEDGRGMAECLILSTNPWDPIYTKIMNKLLLWPNTTKWQGWGRRVWCSPSHRPIRLQLYLDVTFAMMQRAPSMPCLHQSWGQTRKF